MKSTFAIPLLFGAILLASGCAPEEQIVNSFDDRWRILAGTSSGVRAIDMPSGVISSTPVWTGSGSAPYPVQRIQEFRDRIYLLLGDPAIVVLDRSSLIALDTIDLTEQGACAGLAFANATTAYAAMPTTGAVAVIDLTVGMVVRQIPTSGRPVDIAALGNQIAVVIQDAQQLQIIDSRTNTIEATVDLPTAAPAFIAASGFTEAFAVVALGEGKLPNDESTMTPPTMTVVAAADRRILGSFDVVHRASEGPQQLPRGLAVNSQGFAFIPIQQALMFSNTRSANRATPLVFEEFHQISYYPTRAMVIVVRPDGRTIEVYDEFGENRKHQVAISDSIHAVLGIGP